MSMALCLGVTNVQVVQRCIMSGTWFEILGKEMMWVYKWIYQNIEAWYVYIILKYGEYM